MAEDLDNGEFWLPSEFLTDDILTGKENVQRGFQKSSFPLDFPYGFDSSESTLSSSDEEDQVAGLSLHMSQSLALDENNLSTAVWNEKPKTTKEAFSGSPQSTLSELRRCRSGYSNKSSRVNSNGSSQVSSPPTSPMDQIDGAWDLLYAAAGQVMRMKKISEQGLKPHDQVLLDPPRKPVSVPVSTTKKTLSSSYYSDEAFAHQQMQYYQFQMLKKQQLARQQMQNRSRAVGIGHGRRGRSSTTPSSSLWSTPPQRPQEPGSGMRALFLDGSGSKRESVGTGVFLPRTVGNSTEPRRKPGCSTALVPARVAQALNLNLDEMGSTRPRFQGAGHRSNDAHLAVSSHQQQKLCTRPSTATNYDYRLPKDWTY